MRVDDIRITECTDAQLLAMIVRRSFRDVARRFGLTHENCPKHPSNCTDEWIQKDVSRGVTYYVMESNQAAVGCVALEGANPDFCYLKRLSVLPEARGKGCGKALCDHVIDQARAHGARVLGLGMMAQDEELQAWYRRIGFVERRTKQFDHLPFLVTFMKLDL